MCYPLSSPTIEMKWPPEYVPSDSHIEQAAGDLLDDLTAESFIAETLTDEEVDKLHRIIELRIRQAITHRQLYPVAASPPETAPALSVESAARQVLTTFEDSEALGYRSRDRQFAIELLKKAFELAAHGSRPAGRPEMEK